MPKPVELLLLSWSFEEGGFSGRGSRAQNPVIKLHRGGILKNILQERREGKEILWDPRFSHLGEGVINKASIQPCHKSPFSRERAFIKMKERRDQILQILLLT